MTGFERLKEQIEGQKDAALIEVVNYLLSRDDLESRYLNEEKTIEQMCSFIKDKARKNAKAGWNFVTNETVFSWAVMYYTLPNKLLKIKKSTATKTDKTNKTESKDNVVSIEKAKKKDEVKQISLFGGAA